MKEAETKNGKMINQQCSVIKVILILVILVKPVVNEIILQVPPA